MKRILLILASLMLLVSCNPTKRLERLKSKICPYCTTEQGTTDSTVVFYSDSIYWGDTNIVVDNPLTVEVEHDTTIVKILYKDRHKTITRTVLKKFNVYQKPEIVVKKVIPGYVWAFVSGFFILLLIIIAWFVLQLKGGIGAAYKYIKSVFTPKK